MDVQELNTKLTFSIDKAKLKEYDNSVKNVANNSIQHEQKASKERTTIKKNEAELNKKAIERQNEYIYATQAKLRQKERKDLEARTKYEENLNYRISRQKERDILSQKRIEENASKNRVKQDEYIYATQAKLRQRERKEFETREKQELSFHDKKLQYEIKQSINSAKQNNDLNKLNEIKNRIDNTLTSRVPMRNAQDLAFHQSLGNYRLQIENQITARTRARNLQEQRDSMLTYQKKKDAFQALYQVGSAGYQGSKNFMKKAFGASGDFEESLITTRSLAGAPASDIKKLKDQALKLGFDTRFSPLQVSQAQGKLAGQHYNIPQIMGMLPNVLDASAVTKDSPEKVAKAMSAMLHQFKLAPTNANFERVANIIATASGKMGVKLYELETTLKYAGTLAHVSGVTPEEAVALSVGLKRSELGGSMSGTSFRAILADQAQQMNSQAFDKTGKHKIRKTKGQILNEMGVDPYTNGKFDVFKFAEGLGNYKEKNKLNEKEFLGKLAQVFGKTSLTAGAVISALGKRENGQESLIDIHKGFTSGKNTAKGIAKEMNTGTNFTVDQLQSSWDTFLIFLGDKLAPVLIPLIIKVTDFINWLSTSPTILTIITYLTLLIVPMTAILSFVGKIVELGIMLTPLIEYIGVAGMATFGMIALIIGSIVFIIYDVYQALNGGESILLNIGTWFNNIFTNTIPAILTTFQNWMDGIWDSIYANVMLFCDNMVNYFSLAVDKIKSFFSGIGESIAGYINQTVSLTANLAGIPSSVTNHKVTVNQKFAGSGYSGAKDGAKAGVSYAYNDYQRILR